MIVEEKLDLQANRNETRFEWQVFGVTDAKIIIISLALAESGLNKSNYQVSLWQNFYNLMNYVKEDYSLMWLKVRMNNLGINSN